MSGIGFELSYRAKEILSWMVISEVLKLVSDAYAIVHSSPGGGTYDCLALASGNREVLLLNRDGDSALLDNGQVIHEIWMRAARSPREAALYLLSESDIPAAGEAIEANLPAVSAAVLVANFLSHSMFDERRARMQAATSRSTEAQPLADLNWLVTLTQDTETIAIVDLRTGEATSPGGDVWKQSSRLSRAQDVDGLPRAPMGFALINEPHVRMVARPALFGMLRNAGEEIDTQTRIEAITELFTDEEVREIWHDIETSDLK